MWVLLGGCGAFLLAVGLVVRFRDPDWRSAHTPAWWTRNRGTLAALWAPVAAGITLIAVPTAYAVFPELTRRPLYQRWIVGGCWLLLAVGGVFSGAKAQEDLRGLAERAAIERSQQFSRAQRAILDALLEPASGVPRELDFRWTLYIHDGSGTLFPSWPEPVDDPDDPRVFRTGSGATGLAFQERRIVVVIGDPVHDGSYGLTAAQRARFGGDQSVVAIPLRSLDRTVFGVLSGISPVETRFFTTDEGVTVAESLAAIVGTAVSELGGAD